MLQFGNSLIRLEYEVIPANSYQIFQNHQMIDLSKDSEIKSKLQEASKDEKNGLLDSAIAGSSSM